MGNTQGIAFRISPPIKADKIATHSVISTLAPATLASEPVIAPGTEPGGALTVRAWIEPSEDLRTSTPVSAPPTLVTLLAGARCRINPSLVKSSVCFAPPSTTSVFSGKKEASTGWAAANAGALA